MYVESTGTESHYFDSAIYFLSDEIKNSLIKIPSEIKKNTQEIRLRVNKAVSLICANKNFFIKNSGEVTENHQDNGVLKTDKIKSLGWSGRYNLKTGIDETMTILREIIC